MRLRYVKNAQEICDSCPNIYIKDIEVNKGNWRKIFPNENGSLSLEIGCGKGQFLTSNALENPNNCYLGLEMMTSVICRAVERIRDNNVENVKLINKDATNILEYFNEGEIDKLYINFPDPWPKARHEKRRLTSPSFLEKYKVILKKDGVFRFRTDNLDLFNYSKETILPVMDDDVKYGEVVYKENEIQTEFETKFRNQGNPIYFIEGKFRR